MQQGKLRIVYMGTPDFAVYPLEKLLKKGCNIVGVVTNPDKPAGRGQKIQESAVKKYAVQENLKVLQPESFKDEAFLKELKELKADLNIVVAFKMLPQVVWAMPELGTINLHASLLPDYRGAAPINRVIMNGEKRTGVTTFLLNHSMDAGKILLKKEVAIEEDMTAGELHDLLMEVGAELLLKSVETLEKGDYTLTEQECLLEGRAPVHAPKIFKEDMKIDWVQSIDTIYNHIRGLSPFPAAWTTLKNISTGESHSLKIFAVKKIKKDNDKKVGSLYSDGKTFLDIYVQGGVLKIEELQLSGRKRVKIEEFLRGFRIEEYELEL